MTKKKITKKKRQDLREKVLSLTKRVRNKDRAAEDELINIHKQIFGDIYVNSVKRGKSEYYRKDLEIMIQHLLR